MSKLARLLTTFSLLTAFAWSGWACAQVVRYDGHRVVRVWTQNEAQLHRVLQMTGDVWSERIGLGPLDARFAPSEFVDLALSGLPYEVLIEDLQVLIDQEAERHGLWASFFDDYHNYSDIIAFLQQLEANYPNLAQVIPIGQSLENRTIYAIKITGTGADKPAVFYQAMQHAREWIVPTAPLYLAQHLLQNYGADPQVTQLVDGIEWYLVPVLNPDGYEYSWTKDRLWRKNRRNNGNGTWGVDLNRNWSVGWGGGGSSGSGGSEIYRGPAPFSEPESSAARDFVNALPNVKAFLDIHSYGQQIYWPWDYQKAHVPEYDTYYDLSHQISDLVYAVHGQRYIYLDGYDIYQASGTAGDWAYGERGAWTLGFELRDTGRYGFVLPAAQIIPQCEEMLPAILYFSEWVANAGKEVCVPTDIWLMKGTYVSGTLGSLAAQDGDYWQQAAVYDPTDPTAYLNSAILADAYAQNAEYARGTVRVITKTSLGTTSFRLRACRFDAGAWVTLHNAVAGSQADVVISAALEGFAPIGEFIQDSDHKMQLELRNSTSNRMAGFFRHSTDLVEWELWP